MCLVTKTLSLAGEGGPSIVKEEPKEVHTHKLQGGGHPKEPPQLCLHCVPQLRQEAHRRHEVIERLVQADNGVAPGVLDGLEFLAKARLLWPKLRWNSYPCLVPF